jgi:hypothetical protein
MRVDQGFKGLKLDTADLQNDLTAMKLFLED